MAKTPLKRLLLVEDDPDLQANYLTLLTAAGFAVTAAASRAQAEEVFAQSRPDLVILDIGLAGETDGGFELCRSLRAADAHLPIIFLTSLAGESDRISGFRLGADDYLTKDISTAFLVVRIQALLRRTATLREGGRPSTEKDTELDLDADTLRVHWKGQPIELTLTAFWILQALVEHPGHIKSHEQLMQAANVVVEPNTIASHIKNIRQSFRQIDPNFDAIRSERGLGYRWLAP